MITLVSSPWGLWPTLMHRTVTLFHQGEEIMPIKCQIFDIPAAFVIATFQKLFNLIYSSKIANFHNFTFNVFLIAICISLRLRLLIRYYYYLPTQVLAYSVRYDLPVCLQIIHTTYMHKLDWGAVTHLQVSMSNNCYMGPYIHSAISL